MNVTVPPIPAPTIQALTAHPIGIPWPLNSHLRLPAVPESVPFARKHAGDKLRRWRLQCASCLVELVVSELFTNAVRASGMTPGPYLRLWLSADPYHVLVQVWDGNDLMPVLQDAGPDADHGRGLMIVDALSEDWGAYRLAALPGKVTWALVKCGEVH